MIWLAVALMTLAALGLLAWPYLRRRAAPPPREAYDLTVYRDQLDEIENDLARGVISAAEAEGARLEIQRRMLKLAPKQADSATPDAGTPSKPPSWNLRRALPLAALGLALPALAIGLYVSIGSPNLPSRPFASMQGEASEERMNIDAAIAKLKERLERQPDDLNGWVMLGRSYIVLNRYPEAVAALKRATALAGDDTDLVASLAEAMVFEAGGVVTPEARRLFESVNETKPDDAAALYYIGMADAQGGDPEAALATWEKLAAMTPPDASWRGDLVALMIRAAGELGVDPKLPPAPAQAGEAGSGRKDTPAQAGEAGSGRKDTPARAGDAGSGRTNQTPPGPSAEDMAAAAEMSPEERQAMIEGMVARLAARLDENPDDLEGWRRLANAYRVLGRTGKAAEAEANVARLEAEGAAKPAADAEDIADMSPQEQVAMIGRLIGTLERHLAAEPDDGEGWKRLALSYRVLGEMDKALPAYARAAQLAPDNATAQADYAQAILDTSPTRDRVPEEAIALYRRVLALEPNHPDALWFVGYAEATAEPPDKAAARNHWGKLLGLLTPGTDAYKSVENALGTL